jgi:hypothetical protein
MRERSVVACCSSVRQSIAYRSGHQRLSTLAGVSDPEGIISVAS